MLSPNGLTAVFLRTQYDQSHLNRSATSLWFYNLPYTDGYSAIPLTRPIWGVHDSMPNFDAYSRTIFFLSNRVAGSQTAVAPTTQIFQVSVPFPSVVPSIPLVEPVSFIGGLASKLARQLFSATSDSDDSSEQQQQAPSSSASTLAARRARFQEHLRTNVPGHVREREKEEGAAPSLPTASQSTYIDAVQLTTFPLSVDNLLIGFTSDPLTTRSIFAFSARVFPNASMAETASRLAALQSSGGNFRSYDKLFVRHWDEWMDGTRSHIHLMSVQQGDDAAVSDMSEPVDIMSELDSDAPTRPDGNPTSQWSFSRSGINFAFVRQTWDAYSNVSWTDNTDIYTVSMPSSLTSSFSVVLPPVCRTCSNLAIDTAPVYSPIDDDVFAYLASTVPGYESDRTGLRIYWNSSLVVDLTPDWTLSVDSVAWTASGLGLYLGVAANARHQVLLFDVHQRGNSMVLLSNGTNADVTPSPDGSFMLVSSTSFQAPLSIQVATVQVSTALLNNVNVTSYNVTLQDLTAGFNEQALSTMQRVETEEVFFRGANNATIQSWFFQPAGGFQQGHKYPLVYLVHGGPQQAWSDAWSYRWNPQIWAAAGYAVAMINFQSASHTHTASHSQEFQSAIVAHHSLLCRSCLFSCCLFSGSNSFGQAFTDSITGQYGSLPYEDLMLGLKYLLEDSVYAAYLDPQRLGAAGASYGGYMINWIAGHNAKQQYKSVTSTWTTCAPSTSCSARF